MAVKVDEHIGPDEIGCWNCVRWRSNSIRCSKYCYKFSEFKNIDTLNAELKEKGLDYLCVSSIEELRDNRKEKKVYDILRRIYEE